MTYGGTVARARPSLWLLVASLVLTASMMHPGLAAILAVAANAGILLTMRLAAKYESLRSR